MTNSSVEKQWRITAKIDTALCIGDSGSGETGADRTTVKTSDGKLYIPASTLKGIWRHACEAIARGQAKEVCNSPRAESMCAEQHAHKHCIICQIFGSPRLESRIFINDLMMKTDVAVESTEIRNGVTINRSRRVAEDERLYFTETSLANFGIEFSGDVTIGREVTADQLDLLHAGLKYIQAIGTGKSRGLGWLKIKQEELSLQPQKASSITPASEKFTELCLTVTLKSPILPGGRKPTGKAAEAVQYIRGSLIRGAIAKAWLADSEDKEPDDDFRQLFLNEKAGIFRNCYPGSKVLPATAVGCKDLSGFLKEGDSEKHGIFDTLLERLVAEKADRLYQPNCPHCDKGRVESQGGFYKQIDERYEKRTLKTRLLTRVAINRQRKVAEDELLYHLTAVDPLLTDKKNVSLKGSVRVPSKLVSRVSDTLQKQVQRLGGGTSRGLGRVRVKVKNAPDSDSLEERICKFNTGLEKVWKSYRQLPTVEMDAFEGTYFSIDLQSEAILTAEDGWQRSMVLTAPMLQEMTGCTADVTLIRSFASYDYVSGWNAAWGLAKEPDLVTRMGSVFVFHTPDIESWKPCLKVLEETGIGNRREEGFGQILVCDPFHLRRRKHVKSEGTWLENKEETK